MRSAGSMISNITYNNPNSEIYFLQKVQKLHNTAKNAKDSDIVINITDDKAAQKLKVGLDVDYDNNTKVIIGDSSVTIQNKDDNQNKAHQQDQGNDEFLKKKLQQKGNQIIKESVIDCSDSNNIYAVSTVCTLCNVNYINFICYVINPYI